MQGGFVGRPAGRPAGVPAPVDLLPGRRLLFGVVDPVGDYRSATWMVVGKKKTRDVYVGTRDMMHTVKVSIHASGMVRIARTARQAELAGITGDRLLQRLHPPVAPDGWGLKLQIVVPHSCLIHRPSTAGAPSQVSWWPTAGAGTAIAFRVYTTNSVGADQAGQLFMAIGHVGAVQLPGGGSVWVIVDAVPTDSDFETGMATHRAEAQRQHEAVHHRPGSSFEPVQAWGQQDGVPIVIDMGGFVPASS